MSFQHHLHLSWPTSSWGISKSLFTSTKTLPHSIVVLSMTVQWQFYCFKVKMMLSFFGLCKLSALKHKVYNGRRKFVFTFLDVQIIRSTTGFITKTYYKPTFTGLYTNWYNFTQQKYKIIRKYSYAYWKLCNLTIMFSKIKQSNWNIDSNVNDKEKDQRKECK